MSFVQEGKNAGIARVVAGGGPSHAGMGIIATRRCVLTCAHVVNVALGRPADSSERPTEPIAIDFPLTRSGEERHGQVAIWCPVGNERWSDLAVVELDQDVPTDAGVAILADVRARLDNDALSVFGIATMKVIDDVAQPVGQHVDATFRGPVTASDIQINGVEDQAVFVQGGFSGAAVWDEKHRAIIGMVKAARAASGVRQAYMIPTASLTVGWRDLPHEQRRLPRAIPWLWTGFGAVFLGLVLSLFGLTQSSSPDQHPQLAAFGGMHVYLVGAGLLTWLWRLHARNFALHDWSVRLPFFANIRLDPDLGAQRAMAAVALIAFTVVPLYAQAHFIRKIHTQGYVYIYADKFGYKPEELTGCLGRQGLCRHEDATLYSTVEPKSPSEGAYFDNAYHYGDLRRGSRDTVTFWPILQPVVVIIATALLAFCQVVLLLRSMRSANPK